MSFQEIKEYIEKKRASLVKDNDSLDVLSKRTPKESLDKTTNDKAATTGTTKLAETPLLQLGKDYLSEQIAKNGTQVMNNATKTVESTIDKVLGIPVRRAITDAQQVVFNSIAVALTAQNDMAMFFLQGVAKNAVLNIQKKRAIALTLQEKLRHLYNALVIMVAGKPFFGKYLERLRQGLIHLYEAERKFTTVHNTFVSTDKFLKFQFDQGKDFLQKAADQLSPGKQNPDVKFTNSKLLENVGTPKQPQQVTVIVSIPQLVKEVLAAANGYFAATLKVNLLLLAFIEGLDQFQSSSSKLLTNQTISFLETLISKIDSLVGRMANDLNGAPSFIQIPNPDFTPDSVKVSSAALSWLLEIQTIIEYAKFVPGQALTDIQNSNSVVAAYNKAVTDIKKKDTRTDGNATLPATDGREELGQLEAQIQTFSLACLQAIGDAKVAASILSLGRTLQRRIDLSIAQDQEIEAILQSFISTPIPTFAILQRIGNSITSLLGDFGLDRASALLQTGQYSEFFNLNTKTATFAGAALVGIGALKECLTTAEDRAQLTEAERELQRDNKAKELLAQRSAVSGLEQQKAKNSVEDRRLAGIESKAEEATKKCGVPDDFSAPNMLRSLGGVLGISGFGNTGLSKQFTKLGRGIL